MLADLHFIRPVFLLFFLPLILFVYFLHSRQNLEHRWAKIIEPQLLKHLIIVSGSKKVVKPHHILIIICIFTVLALSGPSFGKEASPFAEDEASLVIILEVTPSMLAEDIQPSRLERASQKIEDLLVLRPGTKTALIAYAGSAHIVLPLTVDRNIVSSFAHELSPKIMPTEGNSLAAALKLADRLLTKQAAAGSILVISDGVSTQEFHELSQLEIAYSVQFYAMSGVGGIDVPITSPDVIPLNRDLYEKSANILGGKITNIEADNADLKKLNSRIKSSMAVSQKEGGERWQDSGYWLLPLIALLSLSWFRKGWQLNYE
jgi:Ca-activated chloride channel homolog